MRILHTSDLHGRLNILLRACEELEFDLWIDSGDFFPDDGLFKSELPKFQASWAAEEAKEKIDKIKKTLFQRNIPGIFCSGNHDYIPLSDVFEGIDISHSFIACKGFLFAGIREIPYISGDWKGEVHRDKLKEITEERMLCQPDVMVCHAPPSCFSRYGNISLTSQLFYGEHNIKTVLCGHVHKEGGRILNIGGIQFSNAAGYAQIVTINR